MNIHDTVRAWRQIEYYLSLVKDPILRNAMRYEFEKRAVRDWGYCPAETQTYKDDGKMPELNEDEKEMLDVINGYLEYGVDARTEEQKARAQHEITKARNNMVEFINTGHTFWDIPEELRTDAIRALYDEAFEIVFNV